MFKINKNIYYIILLINILINSKTFGKIWIFTHSYNRPDFIEIQYKTFKKFLKDDYKYFVFNDASDPENYKNINSICKKYKIKCIPIPQKIHTNGQYLTYNPEFFNASIRNCNAVQWSLDNFGFKHNDILTIIDSDIFLTKHFSIKEFLRNYSIGAWRRSCKETHSLESCSINHPDNKQEIKYLWIGLVFLDFGKLQNKETLNFKCGKFEGRFLDSGGYTFNYLKNNPTARVLNINKILLENLICTKCFKIQNSKCAHNNKLLNRLNFSQEVMKLIQTVPIDLKRNIEFFINDTFLHYRGGSNYYQASRSYINLKDIALNKFIQNILNN